MAQSRRKRPRSGNRSTTLPTLAGRGDLDGVLKLLNEEEGNADNQAQALHTACQHGRIDIAELLLMRGVAADAQSTSSNGSTPLHSAAFGASGNSLNIINLLLQHKANFDSRDNVGMPPLMVAVQNEQDDIVKHFLELKADAKITFKQDGENRTPSQQIKKFHEETQSVPLSTFPKRFKIFEMLRTAEASQADRPGNDSVGSLSIVRIA